MLGFMIIFGNNIHVYPESHLKRTDFVISVLFSNFVLRLSSKEIEAKIKSAVERSCSMSNKRQFKSTWLEEVLDLMERVLKVKL